MPKKTPGEPESQLKEASAQPLARQNSLNSYVFCGVFEVSSLRAWLGRKGALERRGSRFWRPRGGPEEAKMEPKCSTKASRERSENRARLGRRLEAVLELEKGMGCSRAAEWRRPPGGVNGGAEAL